jgi:peptidoglycan/LPS O-acetylase OafA/YrhL
MSRDYAKRNHAAWIGPLIALVGLVTYFSVAVNIPDLRDSAFLNLGVVSLGVAVAAWGLLRRRNWKSWLGLLASGGLALLLFGYVFVLSNQLPNGDAAPQVGSMAPPLALPDETGRIVDLGEFQNRRVVVVFYRGFW